MEIMRRYEARLARLEEFMRWWLREQELKRTRPERIAKWMRILAPRYASAPAPRMQGSRVAVPVAPPPPTPEPPLAPFLSPPPPPRPLVEFIQERAGMSIAIDTRTGKMADSATVLMALRTPPETEPGS